MAAATFKGRDAGTTGAPQDLTPAQAAALLPVVTTTARGLAPASGGGVANFLRADGSWAVPPVSGGLSSMGITASAAQINPLANAFDNAFLGAGSTGNFAVGANDFGNAAYWRNSFVGNGITVTKTPGSDALGPYVDLRFSGTSSGAGANTGAFVQTFVPAAVGDTWTASMSVERLSAPNVGTGNMTLCVIQGNASNVYMVETPSAVTDASTPTVISATRVMAAGTGSAACYMYFATPSAQPIDKTYRIRGLQLDKAAARLAYPFKSLSAAEARTAMGVQGAGNLLVNATGRINQRAYVSGAATTAANQFTLDRWFVVTSGQALTFAGTVAGYTMTAPAGGVSQVIEGVNITGGTYCLSWVGSATATVNGTAVANGGTVTLTAGANATVRFTGGTFTQAQLELGTVPTPYQRLDITDETRICERFYERQSYDLPTSGNIATGYWRTRKRATPTIAILSYASGSGGSIAAQPIDPTGAFRPSTYATATAVVLIEGNAELTA